MVLQKCPVPGLLPRRWILRVLMIVFNVFRCNKGMTACVAVVRNIFRSDQGMAGPADTEPADIGFESMLSHSLPSTLLVTRP
jgi:hypothetical protein